MRKLLWSLTRLILRLLWKFFLHLEIKGQENLKDLKKPFIIAIAIHANYADSFIVGGVFPPHANFYPIRFMLSEGIARIPILGSILKAYGAVPVTRGLGFTLTLAPFFNLLKKGEIVGIFIEGRLSKDGRMGEVRSGTAFLALTTDCPVLPIGLNGTFGLNLKNFIFHRKKVTVSFGRPFYAKDFGFSHKEISFIEREALVKLTQIIENKIKELL
jgi:1-acyl-sn-glycerol-3-phosphate acyltransferase